MSFWIPVSVAIGGAFGSLSRYAAGRWVHSLASSGFPWATFAVNIVGSLVVGFWAAWLLKLQQSNGSPETNQILDHAIRVGFLGGFTTFSAFSLETISLIQDDRISLAFLSIAGNLLIGLLAAWFGLKLGNFLLIG